MAWLIILHVTLVDGLSKTSDYFLKIRIMQWLTELQDLKYVQHGVL